MNLVPKPDLCIVPTIPEIQLEEIPMPDRGNGRIVRIIGVPTDLGAGRRGVDRGPSAICIGGITYCESCLAMKIVADSGRLLVLDRVEVNPVVDTENATNSLAVELISSGLGKGIL
jgi:arginase